MVDHGHLEPVEPHPRSELPRSLRRVTGEGTPKVEKIRQVAVESRAGMAGQRGSSGRLAEARRGLGQAMACSGTESSLPRAGMRTGVGASLVLNRLARCSMSAIFCRSIWFSRAMAP